MFLVVRPMYPHYEARRTSRSRILGWTIPNSAGPMAENALKFGCGIINVRLRNRANGIDRRHDES